MRKIISILIFTVLAFTCDAQTITKDYFRWPLDAAPAVAGSFGELRPNHYHIGVDIKTGGHTGLPVHAAADGYVSRISISGSGYGNCIYVTHPNGYTTIYGHLSRFNPAIQKYCNESQYAAESWIIETYPAPGALPVKKGEIICYSGNSGGVRPHLHFEIRETVSQKAINPFLFGFGYKDNEAPQINAIKIYPIGPNSYVKINYPGKSVVCSSGKGIIVHVVKNKESHSYSLTGISSIEANGTIGFGISDWDYQIYGADLMTPYSMELEINKKQVFCRCMDNLYFEHRRYVNAHLDFSEKEHSNHWFERCYLLPNDHATIYPHPEENGKLEITPGNEYDAHFLIKDIAGNATTLNFSFNGGPSRTDLAHDPMLDGDTVIPYNKYAKLVKKGIETDFEPNTFYDDVLLHCKVLPKVAGGYSPVYVIENNDVPVEKFFTIKISPQGIPARLLNKACIVSNADGYRDFIDGYVDNGMVAGKSNELGRFYVAIDTTPPKIVKANPKEGNNYQGKSGMFFKTYDNLAGIRNFSGKIDGKWVLFQYDENSASLYYLFDEHCPPGKHTLALSVTDMMDNTGTMTMNFER